MLLLDILRHTPTWVFAVFVLLVGLGLRQSRRRRVHVVLLAGLPLAMTIWSATGVVQSFGGAALLPWLACFSGCAVVAWRRGARDDVQYSPDARSFVVPGSWLPLALMMLIFFTRYAVGILTAMHPGLPATLAFSLTVAAGSGLTAGSFTARALRIGLVARSRGVASRTATA